MQSTEPRDFNLDRFYYGSFVLSDGRASGTPGVIARTPSITQVQVAECLRLAQVAPPAESSRAMPGTLALLRGESLDYVLVKAQTTSAGTPQLLFILIPAAVLRQLGGNVLAFRPLAMMEMPTFSAARPNLLPFELRGLAPPAAGPQAESLLDLLLFCGDSSRNVESLLAGLVQGKSLLITRSPASTELRLRFVQGLLGLLPAPARAGVTFITDVSAPGDTPAQIQFTSGEADPNGRTVFDWESGRLLSPAPEDAYSHYIVAQLNLDPALVVEQTEHLTRPAVWRLMQRETLSEALSYAARRGALDRAVAEGQPADRSLVARTLRDDPTLPAALRARYARHLLAFALALGEPDSADDVPAACAASREVAQAVVEQLWAAAQAGQAETVYAMVERWLLHVPEAAALPWHGLLHAAAREHLGALLTRGAQDPALEFLDRAASAPPALRFPDAFPELVRRALTAAYAEPRLARVLFLNALRALSAADLCRLFGDARLVAQLPEPVQAALSYLQPEPRRPAPPHILEHGARALGEGEAGAALARLVECAALLQRGELIETAGLRALLEARPAGPPEQFSQVVQQVVQELASAPVIRLLEPPGPRLLVQLLLAAGETDRAVSLLEFYQNEVYRTALLDQFAQLAGDVFRAAALTPEALTVALQALEGSQIRPRPRAAIFAGVLEGRQWADDQVYAAQRLTSMLFGDHTLIDLVGTEQTLRLLEFHARRRNSFDALRVGAALVENAQPEGMAGAPLIGRMWQSLSWDGPTSLSAMELLRRFVRGVPRAQIAPVLRYLTDSAGPRVGQSLRTTCLLRAVTDDTPLLEYVDQVHITAALLLDLANVFHADYPIPPNHRLRRDLDMMPGGLSEAERQQTAQNTGEIAQLMWALGRAPLRGSAAERLAAGLTLPESPLDLLLFVGGQIGRGGLAPLPLAREEMGHLFGTRSAAMVYRETAIAARVLRALATGFDRGALPATPQALADEIASLWSTLDFEAQRRLQAPFARDLQQLAQVIGVMTQGGSDRLLSSGGIGRKLETGRRQPRTGLEAMRWVSGYFARQHSRLRLR